MRKILVVLLLVCVVGLFAQTSTGSKSVADLAEEIAHIDDVNDGSSMTDFFENNAALFNVLCNIIEQMHQQAMSLINNLR